VNVEEGTEQTFTITSDPGSGHSLSELWIDGVNEIAACQTSTGNCLEIAPGTWEYTFSNINQNHTIQAIFQTSDPVYTITASAEVGGSISPTRVVYVEEGGSRTFTMTPERGFRIKELEIDGNIVEPVTTYTFENVTENHAITVRFVENVLKLAITRKQCFDLDGVTEIACGSPASNGVIVNATVQVGNEVCGEDCEVIVVPFRKARALILKAEPNEGSVFVGWEANGQKVEGILDVQHDLLLRPVIRCHSR